MYGKSSTGTDTDPDWNTFAGQCGNIFLGGYVNSQAANIAGVSYTGTTRLAGGGGTQTTLATTTGFYQLTTTATTLFQLTNATAPYTGEYIRTQASVNANASPTVLTLTTTWVSDGSYWCRNKRRHFRWIGCKQPGHSHWCRHGSYYFGQFYSSQHNLFDSQLGHTHHSRISGIKITDVLPKAPQGALFYLIFLLYSTHGY
jgi:hypothetical protein